MAQDPQGNWGHPTRGYMAGKRGRPSKAKAAEQPAAAAVDHDDDNKLDNDSSIKVRRIVRSRRDLDQKVQRAIELHFGHFPRFLVENKIVAGRSLRDRVLNDMEEIEGTANRLGTRYWVNLRSEYGASLDPCANLIIKDTDQKLSDTLVSALKHFTSASPAVRTADPLCSFLSQQVCHAGPKTNTLM